jgi:hypothetical protein
MINTVYLSYKIKTQYHVNLIIPDRSASARDNNERFLGCPWIAKESMRSPKEHPSLETGT